MLASYSRDLFPFVSISLFCLAGAIAFYFFGGMIWGVGYSPTSYDEIDKISGLLELRAGEKLYDLGCGYGRVIFRMAQKHKVDCVGVEADPLKCWWIRRMIHRKKLGGRVWLIQSDLLRVDLRDVDNVFIFLTKVTHIMIKLQEKLLREMKPGTRIVSYVHTFDNWTPDKQIGELYLYSIPGGSTPSREI